MSLINCPECNKEISSSAESCPECGHQMKPKHVVNEPVVLPNRNPEEPFPKWIIAPMVIVGVLILFGVIYMLQRDEKAADENLNVNLSTDMPVDDTRRNTTDAPARTMPENPTTTDVDRPENNQTIGAETTTEVKDDSPEMGNIEINAKVADLKGNINPVEAEKFYLLDEELSLILTEAKLEPIRNLSLVNSFGLSVLNPGKYGDFNKRALGAINEHIKYSTMTDSTGVARIGKIKPDSYYIFGIHKLGKGFAVWSSPVSIKPGKNNLNIQPQRMQEFQE